MLLRQHKHYIIIQGTLLFYLDLDVRGEQLRYAIGQWLATLNAETFERVTPIIYICSNFVFQCELISICSFYFSLQQVWNCILIIICKDRKCNYFIFPLLFLVKKHCQGHNCHHINSGSYTVTIFKHFSGGHTINLQCFTWHWFV